MEEMVEGAFLDRVFAASFLEVNPSSFEVTLHIEDESLILHHETEEGLTRIALA